MNTAQQVRLADEAEVITKGTTPTTLGFKFESDGVPFVRAQNLVDGTVSIEVDPLYISQATHEALKRSQILPADVLVSIAGTIGRTAVVPDEVGPMNCNQAVAIIRPSGRIDRRFLLHWFSSNDARSQVAKSKVTATISNLSLSEIGNLNIPLPPLSEQRRIAAILDKADTLRRKRKRAIDLLDSLTQSIFLKIGQTDHAVERKIGSFARVLGGKRLPKGHDYVEVETGFKYLRVTDLQDLSLDYSTLKNLSPETYSAIKRYTVREDDVVISIAGTIGQTRHIDASLDGVNLTENAAKIVLNADAQVDPVYLEHALRSEQCQNDIRASTGQVTIGKLALFRIEELSVPLPSLGAQKAFRSSVDCLGSVRRRYVDARAKMESLFYSLQLCAFSGRL